MNKGGLELEIKSMRAFMPAGQVDIYFQKDISTLIGQRMTVEVTQFDRAAKNLIVSRRNVLEREREQQKQKLMEELAEGQIRRGTVRSVMDFGAFVDLGGVDGLLHVSEMTFKRGRQNAAEFVKVGDALDVKVLKIDRDTGKLSLSLKQARGTDPWADAAVKYPVGTTLTGRVTRVESFGAFIEVEEGLEGLLPVSEISWQRIKSPQDVLHEGDTIKLVVISLDAVQKRISFSLKQAGPDPWATINDRYAVDMVVDGTITRIAEFGAFVELESGLEGLVHISELAGQRVTSVASAVKAGQIARVRILDIDKDNRRIGLSIKKVAEIEAAPPSAAATTPAPAKKKKNELRGGLDFNFWNKK
jgi:small subunit ribosomal protein S1